MICRLYRSQSLQSIRLTAFRSYIFCVNPLRGCGLTGGDRKRRFLVFQKTGVFVFPDLSPSGRPFSLLPGLRYACRKRRRVGDRSGQLQEDGGRLPQVHAGDPAPKEKPGPEDAGPPYRPVFAAKYLPFFVRCVIMYKTVKNQKLLTRSQSFYKPAQKAGGKAGGVSI